MRHALVVSLSLVSTQAFAESETYQPIRVDAGFTASRAGITDRNGGGMVVEIKAMAHDQIAIGGRVEIAVMFGGQIGDENTDVDAAMAASALVKGEYFIGREHIRPFVGLGLGAYTIGGQSISTGPDGAGIDQRAGRYFGVAPQIGVDLGRLRLAATYNAILGAQLEVRQMVGNAEQVETFSQNYLSLEMSFQFGGGRKKRDVVMTGYQPPVYPPPPPVYRPPPVYQQPEPPPPVVSPPPQN
jgi:outer membrane protein W